MTTANSGAEHAYHYSGSCRCGGVSVTYASPTPAAKTPVICCQCEFCAPQQHGFVASPEASLVVSLRHRHILYAHRFGTYTADFCHCAVCNELMFARADIDGHTYAAVCADRLADGAGFGAADKVDFEHESIVQRNQRRASSWVKDYTLRIPDAD